MAVFSTNIFTVAFQSVPPMIPQLMNQFSVSTVQAGLLMSMAVVPGIFLSLPSGWLLNRYHAKKVGVVASLCMVIACIFTVISNSFELMLVGRFLLGVGGNLMLITTLGMVSQWFNRKERGKAMGLLGASTPIVTIITFSGVSLAEVDNSWRLPFYISLLLAVVGIVIFLFGVKDNPHCEEKAVEQANKSDYLNAALWKIAIISFCIHAAATAFSTWAPTLFTQYSSMSIVEASLMGSLSILPTILSLPLFGYLSDRTGKRRFFIFLGPILTAVAFLALAFGPTSIVVTSVLFMGVASAIALPTINAMPPEILGCKKAGVGFGIIAVFGALSSVLAVVTIGYLIDVSDSLMISLLGMGAFPALAVIVALTLKTK